MELNTGNLNMHCVLQDEKTRWKTINLFYLKQSYQSDMFKKILLIYDKQTGKIVATNVSTSGTLTFENMYPHASEEFKQKYGGLVVPYDPSYERNKSWYKVENGEIIKLASPFIVEQQSPKRTDPRDQRIADLEIAIAAILGGAV